eukprot:scaffold77578_cov62-Phaeocystis_antarctica.AAC.4
MATLAAPRENPTPCSRSTRSWPPVEMGVGASLPAVVAELGSIVGARSTLRVTDPAGLALLAMRAVCNAARRVASDLSRSSSASALLRIKTASIASSKARVYIMTSAA